MALDTNGVVTFVKAHPVASGGLVLAVIVGTWVLTSPKQSSAPTDVELMGGGITYGSGDIAGSMQMQAMEKQMAFAREQMNAESKLAEAGLSAQLELKRMELTNSFDLGKMMASLQGKQVDNQFSLSTQELAMQGDLANKQLDLTKFMAELASSPQTYVSQTIDRLYAAVGRTPDPAGKQYWEGAAVTDPRWTDALAAGLVQDAPKFNGGGGDTSAARAEAQVRLLYASKGIQNPDAEGLAYWTREAASGKQIADSWTYSYNKDHGIA